MFDADIFFFVVFVSQNGRVSQCAINKEGSQAEYTMAMIGTVILDLFFGPEESYDPRYDIQDKDLVETRALIADLLQREANASITTAAAVQTSPSNTANNPQYLHPRFALPTFPFLHQTILLMQTLLHKLRIMPVAVHANYCDHKKPWLEEKGMWLVKSFDTNKPCLRCLKLNLDGTWFASHPWEDSLRNALKELKDIRNIRINSVVKMSKFREIFLVTNDSFRPFANGEVFLAKGYQWKDIQKISHPYFYFLDKGIGAVVLNDTSLVSTEGLPQ